MQYVSISLSPFAINLDAGWTCTTVKENCVPDPEPLERAPPRTVYGILPQDRTRSQQSYCYDKRTQTMSCPFTGSRRNILPHLAP